MSIRILRSAWLSAALAVALLLSLAAHVWRGSGARSRDGCHVVALELEGESVRPEITLDFDANLAVAPIPKVTLGAEYVSLDPAVPVDVRVVSARRLVVVPRVPLARFASYRVRLGRALASADGRPAVEEGGVPLSFMSATFELADAPRPRVDDAGNSRVELVFTGPVAEGSLAAHARLVDSAGVVIPTTLDGNDARWALVSATRPARATLEIRAGLASAWGGIPLANSVERALVWSDTLAFENARASYADGAGEIHVQFDRPVDVRTAPDFVSVTPEPVGLVRRARGNEVVLRGAFVPGNAVAVNVREGLVASNGLRLPKSVRRVVTIPTPPSTLGFVGEGTVLSSEAIPTLEFSGVNVPEVLVEARRVFPTNVVPLALRWTDADVLAGDPVERRMAIDAPAHAPWKRTVDLAALLGPTRRGVVSLTISDPRSRWRSDQRLLQITDLAPVLRRHPDGVAVFVARISDGGAVAGAKVTAFTSANQIATEGVTDRDGLLVVRHVAREIRVVTVVTPDDSAFIDVATHAIAHDARDVEGLPVAHGLEAYVRADRGLVRPGETAHVDAIVRVPSGEAPAEGLGVRLSLTGPDGRTVKRFDRRTGIGGLVDASFPIGVDAPTGAYWVRAEVEGVDAPVGAASFRVEAYVPDRLEVEVSWPEGELTLGATVPATVRAHVLTGEPAAGLVVRARLALEDADGAPIKGFVFGDAEAPSPRADEREREAVLDAKGEATIAIPLADAGPAGRSRRATVRVEVIDVSGRAVAAAVSRVANPAGPRLGVALATGAPFAADVVVYDAHGVKGPAITAVKATLSRVSFLGSYVLEHRRRTWRSERVETLLATRDVALTDGRGRVEFDRPNDGNFVVRVRADGAVGAALPIRVVEGRTSEGARAEASTRLWVERDGPARPGARAAVLVTAPFAGRALLSLEGGRVFEARTIELPAGRSRVEFDVPEAAWPSLHAVVTLVRGAKAAGTGAVRAFGAAAVTVDRPERQLKVTLDSPDVALPEATLAVRVKTSAPAEVVLHLVDAGILRRTHHGDADPVRRFGAVRRLETSVVDAWSRLVEGVRFPSDDPDPGGDGPGELGARLDPTAKNVIETVALVSKRVVVDGEAIVSFDLPPYEGRLRLVAIAASREGTGAAARDVVVKGPIGIAIHAPRAVAPGDLFEAAVEVRGNEVVTEVVLDGFERRGEGFPLALSTLDRMGVGSITVRAHDAAGNQRVRTARISIRPAAPRTTESVVLSIGPRESSPRDLPGRFLEGTRRARVTVGAGPLLELLPALGRLQDYPYGCVEQTTSRAFPVLASSALAALVSGDGGRPDDVVDEAIERLYTMQTASGAFSMWPGGTSPDAFGTIYATHFLLEAKRLGRAVSEERLTAAIHELEDLQRKEPKPYLDHVLALAGKPVRRDSDLHRDDLTVEDRAHLAATWLRAGDRKRAEELLAAAGDPFTAARTSTWDHASPLRAAAVLLDALVDVVPDDPRVAPLEAKIRLIARSSAVKDWTTQESAVALLAIVKRHAKSRETLAGLHGSLRVGSRHAAISGPEGAMLEWREGDPWTFEVDASAPVSVVVRVDGVAVDAPAGDVDQGMRVRRNMESIDGSPVDSLVQGRVYRVVLEGTLPVGLGTTLLSDVLPGGLEIEEARATPGDWNGDRTEVRDDRVLYFATRARSTAEFKQTYLVRAVTPGRYRVPPTRVEALYDPALHGQGSGGGTIEVRRAK